MLSLLLLLLLLLDAIVVAAAAAAGFDAVTAVRSLFSFVFVGACSLSVAIVRLRR